jgi:hypothetical protein
MAAARWPEATAAQGIDITWNDFTITATSVSYNRQAQGEVDITSMESTTQTDRKNSKRMVVRKSVEFAVVDLGEVSMEFVGPGGFNDTFIGMKSKLAITGSAAANFPNDVQAFLTALSVQASAGELVRGNCTFRLSDT